MTTEEFQALPIGAKIRCKKSDNEYTKTGDNEFTGKYGFTLEFFNPNRIDDDNFWSSLEEVKE